MYELMLATNVVIFVLVCAYFSRQPAASVFHPVTLYLAFHGLLFVYRPILSHYYGYRLIYRLFQFEPSMSDKLTVLAAASLGLVCFVAGALQTGNAPMVFRQSDAIDVQRKLLFKPLAIALGLTAPIAIVSIASHWQQRTYKLGTMVLDSGTGVSINTDKNGYFTEAQMMLVPITVLFAWMFRFRWWSLIPFAVFLVARAGTGGRGPFVVAAAALAMLYLYQRRWKWPEWRSLLLFVGIVLAFNEVGSDRGQAVRDFVNSQRAAITDQTSDSAIVYPMEGMDFGNLEFFEFLVYVVPQRSGTYEYFADQLQIFTEPIPRVIWKNKPIGSPVQFFNVMDYGRPVGMTRSLPGEGWTQLGWIGVAVWCGLWGALLGYAYSRFVRSRQGIFHVLTYVMLVASMIITYRDGYPITLLRMGLFFFAPLLVWWGVARMMGVPSNEMIEFLIKMRRARGQQARARAPEPDALAPEGEPGEPAVVPRSQRPHRGALPRAERMRRRLAGLTGET